MKKLFLCLVVAVVTIFNANAQKEKPGIYYAVADGGGAYTWGSAGTALGPLGTACGIVLGGVCTSSWVWYWDHYKTAAPVITPKATFASGFSDTYQQSGYNHNSEMRTYVNNNQVVYPTAKDFVDASYTTLCQNLAKTYNLDVNKVYIAFPKNQLITELNKYNDFFVEGDIKVVIAKVADIIKAKYGNDKLSSIYSKVANEVATLESTSGFDIEKYINTQIDLVNKDAKYTAEEKAITAHSLNVFKYSYALWTSK